MARDDIDRLVTPSPTSTIASTGSDAASPHTPTVLPRFSPAAPVNPTSLSRAGCQGSLSAASGPAIRSAARVYWARSFVPMLANSVTPRICSAFSAAAGTSTITPGVLRPCSRTLPENHSASLASAIIGAITHTSDELRSAARAMACSWRSRIPESSNATRTPRTPSAGLGSSPWSRKASGLSAPASSVRTTTFLPSGKAAKTPA